MMEAPGFRLAPPPNSPAFSLVSGNFYAGYPSTDWPELPAGQVQGRAAFQRGGATVRADPFRQGMDLAPQAEARPEPAPATGVDTAQVEYLGLQIPPSQPSLAQLFWVASRSAWQHAYYATTTTVDPWSLIAGWSAIDSWPVYDQVGNQIRPVEPQPSLGVANDFTPLERATYAPNLAKVFVNSDGTLDPTGQGTCDQAYLGPLADLSTIDLDVDANGQVDNPVFAGYWNLYFNESASPDPFGWLYEEAYRSFIFAVSVRNEPTLLSARIR